MSLSNADIAFNNQVASYYETSNFGKYTKKPKKVSSTVTDSELQAMALAAYQHDPQVGGWAFIPALSTYDTKVWYKPGSNVAVVGFKGTEPTHIRDIYTDLRLAQGELGDTERAVSSYATLKNVHDQLPGFRIMVTGHSLGGSLAREVSNEPFVHRAVGFNTGYSVPLNLNVSDPIGFVKQSKAFHKETHREHPKFEDYINTRDIVSTGRIFARDKRHHYYSRGWGLAAHRPTYFP